MAFTYTGDPSTSDKDSVRFEIQDTNPDSPLLQDAEITWCILAETGTAAATPATIAETNPHGFYSACARAMETLARLFSAQADTEVGSLRTTYSKQAAGYTKRAQELRAKAQAFGEPYAGGQSITEKQAASQDADAVQPAFRRSQFDTPYAGDQQRINPEDLGPPLGP